MEYPLATYISPSIFRAYDIRGEAYTQLTESVVYTLGRALAQIGRRQGHQQWLVGRDGRLSGPALIKALKRGLLDGGASLIDLGCVPTPVLYFGVYCLKVPCGIMLTGSHNPSPDNGLKIVLGGKTLSGEAILNIAQEVQEGNWQEVSSGQEVEQSILTEYQQAVVSNVHLSKPLTVVIDCGNGVAGILAESLFQQLGCRVIPLFCEVDGHFPNHHPDPTKSQNLQVLIETVKRHQADVGIAFDGDGDRLGVVSDQGRIIWPDRQLMWFAESILAQQPGAKILFDVKCSKNLIDHIRVCGGEPVMCKTGHSFIKNRLVETQAPLAGEMSGHLFFNDRWYGFDDGLYAAARFLELLSQRSDTCDQIFQQFSDSVSTPELQIPVKEEKKFEFVERFIQTAEFVEGEKNMLDGLRVDFPDGWGLVRASNTTSYLVMRFEAKDERGLQRIQQAFSRQLKAVDPELELGF